MARNEQCISKRDYIAIRGVQDEGCELSVKRVGHSEAALRPRAAAPQGPPPPSASCSLGHFLP